MIGLVLSLVGLWVLLGAIWLAVWPLFAAGGGVRPEADVERAELEAEKARLLGEIHELELDWETGKLSEEDYRTIESRLKERAMEVMRRIDALAAPGPRARRERPRAADGSGAEPAGSEASPPSPTTAGRTSG